MDSRKITAALAIAALMTLAVVTAGCTTTSNPSPTPTPVVQTATTTPGNNRTLTSTAGFKITFPSQYKYDRNESTPVKVYIYLDPTNNVTGVNVGTQRLQSNATLDSISNNDANQLRTYENFTTIQKITNGTLGGKPARTLTYQAIIPVQYNQTTSKNRTLQVQTIWTMNNNTGYIITYKAPPSDFSKFLLEAQKIVNSFQLT
ncbi:MAG: PsbP-related protein [Halobacteriota archaeon]